MGANSDTLVVSSGTGVLPPSGAGTPAPAPAPTGQQPGTPGAGTPGQTPSSPAPTGQQPGQPSGAVETGLPRTKEELDKRVEQAVRSGMREVLKALGFSDLNSQDDLVASLKQAAEDVKYAKDKKLEAMTAEQKVQAQIDDLANAKASLEKKLQDEQQARKEAEGKLTLHLRNTALMRSMAGARHPEDVVTWTEQNKPDLLKNVLKPDGTPDEATIKTLVDECKKARPEWFEVIPGVPSNAGAKPPTAGVKADEAKTQAALEVTRSAI